MAHDNFLAWLKCEKPFDSLCPWRNITCATAVFGCTFLLAHDLKSFGLEHMLWNLGEADGCSIAMMFWERKISKFWCQSHMACPFCSLGNYCGILCFCRKNLALQGKRVCVKLVVFKPPNMDALILLTAFYIHEHTHAHTHTYLCMHISVSGLFRQDSSASITILAIGTIPRCLRVLGM